MQGSLRMCELWLKGELMSAKSPGSIPVEEHSYCHSVSESSWGAHSLYTHPAPVKETQRPQCVCWTCLQSPNPISADMPPSL